MAELRRAPVPISPELCLVDAELAAWARLRAEERPGDTVPSPAPIAVAGGSTFREPVVRVALGVLALVFVLNVVTLTGSRVSFGAHLTADGRTEIAWRPVVGATAYDVILWRGSKRVLDLWPTAAHVTLPARWRSGGELVTPRSGLLWFVYPVLARSPESTFGPLAASGQLKS